MSNGLLNLYDKEKEKNKLQEKTLIEFANEREKILSTPVISKDKITEKIDIKFREAKGLYERGVQPQAQYTMKLLRDLEKDILEE